MRGSLWLLLWIAPGWAQLWQPPPADTLDLWKCGPGGCAATPAPPFHFVKEDESGSTAKLDVRDANGRTWSVKFGAEVIPECFASRFVAAAGYFTEPTYFVAEGKVEGTGKLRRARRMVKPDGRFARGRFEMRGSPDFVFVKGRSWGWTGNSLGGPHQLGGLKVMMMLLSNWDAKDDRDGSDSNNGVFRIAGKPSEQYGVYDWGASLGRWGNLLRRDQSDCAGFMRDTADFVHAEDGGALRWGFVGKHGVDLTNATAADVRWLLPYLEQLNPDHIVAGLRASGATDRQARCWSESIQSRIRAMRAAVSTSTGANNRAGYRAPGR